MINDWQKESIEEMFSFLEERINEHLKECAKCRNQTSFKRPPISQAHTWHGLWVNLENDIIL